MSYRITSIDRCPLIPNEISMSSESTIDVMKALVNSSTLIPDETYVHGNYQRSQETEIGSIVTTPSISSSTMSLEFLDIVHQVSSNASSLSGHLDFSPEFFQISVSPTNVITLQVSEVRLSRKPISFFPYL